LHQTGQIKQKKKMSAKNCLTLAHGLPLNHKGKNNYTVKRICDVILMHIVKKMLIRQRTVLSGMCLYVAVQINVRTCVFILSVIVTR